MIHILRLIIGAAVFALLMYLGVLISTNPASIIFDIIKYGFLSVVVSAISYAIGYYVIYGFFCLYWKDDDWKNNEQ